MEILLMNNTAAAEAFAACGIAVRKEDLRPVMLGRTGEKNKTNLCLACWKVKGQSSQLLRLDTGELLIKPKFAFCRELKLFEGFLFDDGTYVNLSVFSLQEGKIGFNLGMYQKVIYRRIIDEKKECHNL